MIIGEGKDNIVEANKVGLLYKKKFLFYTLTLMVSVIFVVFEYFNEYFPRFKIIN